MSKIQLRRGTAAQWTSANPTLSSGEFGFETDTYKFKIGDGATAWTSLAYFASTVVQNKYDATTAPTTTNDSSEGYGVGSVWVDVTGDVPYMCVDSTATAAVWIDISGGGATGTQEYQTAITTASTTITSTHIGSDKVNVFDSATAQTATLNAGVGALNDEIYFDRVGVGSFELVKGTNVRLSGVRDLNNRFFINNRNSWIAAKYKNLDGSTEVWEVVGRLTDGYSGAVTTSNYTNLEPAETIDVNVTGTGFSANMLDPVITGNATLNSWTYNSGTSITLNITSSGSESDTLTITYDNGDVFVDTDAITLTTISTPSIVITTTSTSASWSPNFVTNSGSTLNWAVTGDATPSSTDANDPTIDLSSNVGTAIITVTSADDLAGLTVLKTHATAPAQTIDITDATALDEFSGTSGSITSINTTGLTSLTKLRVGVNSLTSLDVSTNTGLTILEVLNNSLTSLDVSTNTALTNLRAGSNPSLGNVDLSTNTALQVIELYACGLTGAQDFTNNTLVQKLRIYVNASATSIDVTGCTVLDELNCYYSGYQFVTGLGDSGALLGDVRIYGCALTQSGVNNVIINTDNGKVAGTRVLNYDVVTGTNATPTLTESTTNDVQNAYNNLVADGWTITGAAPA